MTIRRDSIEQQERVDSSQQYSHGKESIPLSIRRRRRKGEEREREKKDDFNSKKKSSLTVDQKFPFLSTCNDRNLQGKMDRSLWIEEGAWRKNPTIPDECCLTSCATMNWSNQGITVFLNHSSLIVPQQRVAAHARMAISSNSLQGSILICCSCGGLEKTDFQGHAQRSLDYLAEAKTVMIFRFPLHFRNRSKRL